MGLRRAADFELRRLGGKRGLVQGVALGKGDDLLLLRQVRAIGLELGAHRAVGGGDVVLGGVDEVQQHAAALDVAEEARAETCTLVCALDQTRDVGQHEIDARLAHDAEVGMQRGEGIVGDLGLGRADGCQERRLAGVRQADDAGVGDQLEPQPDGQLLARLAGIGVARRPVGRRLEVRIAEAAVAAAGEPHAVAGLHDLGEQRLLVLGNTCVPGGTAITASLPDGPDAVLPHAAAAALGLEVLAVAVVDQRVEVGDALHPHVAALAAVAAVGAAELDEFLAPERDAAGPACARGDIDLGLVEEFHVLRIYHMVHALPYRGRANAERLIRRRSRSEHQRAQAGPPPRRPSQVRQRGRARVSMRAGSAWSACLASSQ